MIKFNNLPSRKIVVSILRQLLGELRTLPRLHILNMSKKLITQELKYRRK